MTDPTESRGIVYLVGAGPGDPGLLTLRGRELLSRADVVLYDYLVNPLILQHALATAEFVCLGRHGHGRILTQDEINHRMVGSARAGKLVVRLKGGDPAVFAHLAEELAALSAAKVRYEVVPGITAALAVGSHAGILLTHSSAASAVALVTGRERSDKDEPALDYASLATFPGTLVFYMGVTTAPVWTEALMEAGKPANTPAVIIRRCSWPDQRQFPCTLGTICQTIADLHIRPPVVTVVGTAARASKDDWFSRRPLFGMRVLVTRPVHQSSPMAAELLELGADVLFQPAIDIRPPADWSAVDAAIQQLDIYDWIVFSSANGVRFFLDRILGAGRDTRTLSGSRLAAIGVGTQDELRRFSLSADVVPSEFRAESLVAALQGSASGKRFLLVRASRGRELLAEELTSAGGSVTQVVAYESRDVASADPQILELLARQEIDWITVTSSAIARSLHRMFGDRLKSAHLASISPVTSATLVELGLNVAVEARQYTASGLAAAILAANQR